MSNVNESMSNLTRVLLSEFKKESQQSCEFNEA